MIKKKTNEGWVNLYNFQDTLLNIEIKLPEQSIAPIALQNLASSGPRGPGLRPGQQKGVGSTK